MEVDSKSLSDESINSILQYLPYFSKNNTFGEWKGSDENEDGVKTFPHLIYSTEVNQFVKLLYRTNFIVSFDWGKWDEGRKIISDKNLIQKSDLLTLRMLITAVVRNDRFCEGSLLSSIENKTILTILQRLKTLRDNNELG